MENGFVNKNYSQMLAHLRLSNSVMLTERDPQGKAASRWLEGSDPFERRVMPRTTDDDKACLGAAGTTLP